ncbi:GNAT family N-acetyltransferase [Streptomyces sp. NPDC059037]|uniref:GNAT family N-acetyltransferase n=1 Tax=Streptomyces sp. NPDC059037 TaxID=3346710 RepID=UPI0036B3B050
MTSLLTRSAEKTAVLVDFATSRDVAALRQLYFTVYGNAYPVRLGSCPTAMAAALDDPGVRWLVARSARTGEIVGSAILRGDSTARIGKIEGVVVHPDHSGMGIARALLSELCEDALGQNGALDSVYATARCTSPAPQRALMRHGLRPLGLLPGAVELQGRETLALVVRHREAVLAHRAPIGEVPDQVVPLLDAARDAGGIVFDGVRPRSAAPNVRPRPQAEPIEVIQAAGFVSRRFSEAHGDDTALLPLGVPNVLLTPPDGRFEAYGSIDTDGGCGALLDVEPSADALGDSLGAVVQAMADRGATYVETLLPLADCERLTRYLAHGFVPSAVYPAMRCDDGEWHDYIVLTHTTGRPDFRGLALDARFIPYLDQYSRSWTSTYLNTLPEEPQR